MKEENLDMALFKLDAFIQEYKPSEKAIENRALLETPVMLGYFESKALLNYIENLQSQLKAKEEELKYTVPIVEHNKIVSKKNKQIKQLKEVIKEAREYVKIYRSYANINGKDYLKGRDEIGELSLDQVDSLLEILSKGENKETNENDKNNNNLICSRCGKQDKTVDKCFDPYDKDVNEILNFTELCDECYQDRVDAI